MKESMKTFPLTSIEQYNPKISKLNNWIRQNKIKRPGNPKNLRRYFTYLRFNQKLNEANLHAHKFAIFKSIEEFYSDKHDYKTIAIYREFFRSLEYRVRPAVIDEDQLLTEIETIRLFSFCTRTEFAVCFFLYLTGFRNHELRKTLLTDCKKEKNRIKITIIGKNRKKRFVTIPEWLFTQIKEVFKSKVYLFESKNHKPLQPTTVQFLVREASKRAKIKKTVTPKLLRITLLNHIYRKFPDMDRDFMIQKFGHSHAVHERWYRVFMSKGSDKFQKFEKTIINLVKIKSGKRLIA